MGLYRRFILPRLIDFAMREKAATARRSELIPRATGSVLEIGIGSGLNLPFYSSAATHLRGIDSSAQPLSMARKKTERMTFPVEVVCPSAAHLPVDAGSIATAATTSALCCSGGPPRALRDSR